MTLPRLLAPLCLVAFSWTAQADTESAVFAGGCFWCMQPPYDKLEGVEKTEVGFMGGDLENPSYDDVVAGGTGHLEVMRVTWDPDQMDYEELLEVFWVNVDPLDDGGQFCDRGEHYTTAIFYKNDQQRAAAEASKQRLQDSDRLEGDIVTPVREAGTFYLAEAYHQDYYRKNPVRYRFYRSSCGRDRRLDELWGDDG